MKYLCKSHGKRERGKALRVRIPSQNAVSGCGLATMLDLSQAISLLPRLSFMLSLAIGVTRTTKENDQSCTVPCCGHKAGTFSGVGQLQTTASTLVKTDFLKQGLSVIILCEKNVQTTLINTKMITQLSPKGTLCQGKEWIWAQNLDFSFGLNEKLNILEYYVTMDCLWNSIDRETKIIIYFQWWFLLGNHNHQANPHVHQQHVVLVMAFPSGLPQPLSSDLIEAGATETETSLPKQHAAGERVDLLDENKICYCCHIPKPLQSWATISFRTPILSKYIILFNNQPPKDIALFVNQLQKPIVHFIDQFSSSRKPGNHVHGNGLPATFVPGRRNVCEGYWGPTKV